MKFNQNFIGKFQEGGAMPSNEPAPVQEAPAAPEAPANAGGDQLQQIAAQLAQMLLEQVGDPAIAAQILQMALEMVSQSAPAPGFARMGGRLVRIK